MWNYKPFFYPFPIPQVHKEANVHISQVIDTRFIGFLGKITGNRWEMSPPNLILMQLCLLLLNKSSDFFKKKLELPEKKELNLAFIIQVITLEMWKIR